MRVTYVDAFKKPVNPPETGTVFYYKGRLHMVVSVSPNVGAGNRVQSGVFALDLESHCVHWHSALPELGIGAEVMGMASSIIVERKTV